MISDNLREQLLLLPAYLEGHLLLTLFALSLGIAVSVPLGILANQQPALKRPLLISVSILQTIPSLAILALTVAALGKAAVAACTPAPNRLMATGNAKMSTRLSPRG